MRNRSLEDWLHPLVGRYVQSPQWVKSVAGAAYGLLPRSARFGKTYPRFLEAFELKDFEHIHSKRLQLLANTLIHCVKTVPVFSNTGLSIEQIENDPIYALGAFPLTSKSDIKRQPASYLSTAINSNRRLPMATGGSTAEPMQFFLERGVSRSKEWAAFDVMNQQLGHDRNEIVLALRGRTVPGAVEGKQLWMYEPIKRHLILSSDHLEMRFMPQYIRAIEQHCPTRIHAFASALFPLARWFQLHPAPHITRAIRGIVLTSESVFDFQMDLFREVFDCPVIRHYGHSERVAMAHTLPNDDNYHFLPLYGWVELVDDDGQTINEPGKIGEIVGTGFDNCAMPFVRYRTGDLAVLADCEQPFALGAPIVSRIEGRKQEFVVCHDHRLVTITTLGAAHFEDFARFEQIQFEQRSPGNLILRVQTQETELSKTQRDKIQRAVREKTQGGCEVEIEIVPRIERTAAGKLRLLIQHLPLDSYFGASLER